MISLWQWDEGEIIFSLHSKIEGSRFPWVRFHLMGCVVLLKTAVKDHQRGNHFLERRHIIGGLKQLIWAVLAVSKRTRTLAQ